MHGLKEIAHTSERVGYSIDRQQCWWSERCHHSTASDRTTPGRSRP